MSLTFENPILTRELRTRMRGARAFWVLFAYLGLLSGILGVSYFLWNQNNYADGFSSGTSFLLGRQFYAILFTVQAALVGLITPALTAGALSMEREQQTFDALAVSRLPRRTIVVGKLVSALSFVLLLMVGSAPLTALCFLLGGVSPAEVGVAYLLLAASAFLYGATGIAFSSFAKSTVSATVLTYGTILLFFLGTLPMAASVVRFDGSPQPEYFRPFLCAVNPVGAMSAGAITETYFGLAIPAWLTALIVNGLLGSILTLVALHRLEFPRNDRSGLLRLLSAAFFGILSLLVCGHSNGSDSLGISMAGLISLPVLLVPLFATADGLPAGSLRSAFAFSRLKKGEAPSGALFCVLIVLGWAAVSMLTWTFNLGPHSIDRVGGFFLAPLSMVAFTAIWSVIALAISRATKNRWASFAIVAALMLTTWILPVALMSLSRIWGVNFLNLTPIASFDWITRTLGMGRQYDGMGNYVQSHLLLGDFPMGLVALGIHSLLGLAAVRWLVAMRRKSPAR